MLWHGLKSSRTTNSELIQPPTPPSPGAQKDTVGRLRYDLIPVRGLREEAIVYTKGAGKYADHNWRKGLSYSQCLGALMRHLEAFRAGESRDPDNGQHHLASVKFWCNALMEYEVTHPELDDREDKTCTIR